MAIQKPVRSSDRTRPIGGRDAAVHITAQDANAAATTAEIVVWRAPFPCVIKSATVTPKAGVTANNTNYASLLIDKRPASAPGTPANVATLTTEVASGSWVAWTPKSLGAIANGTLAEGDVLTFEVTKAGTGVQLPASAIDIVVERTS